jgi:hypothetical protein
MLSAMNVNQRVQLFFRDDIPFRVVAPDLLILCNADGHELLFSIVPVVFDNGGRVVSAVYGPQ